MSTASVKAFFEALNSNRDLVEKLAAADKAFGEKHKSEEKNETTRLAAAEEIIIPVAKEAGFNFTINDLVAFEAANAPNEDEEIDDGELAQVAGGTGDWGAGISYCMSMIGMGVGCQSGDNGTTVCAAIGIGSGTGICLVKGTVTKIIE